MRLTSAPAASEGGHIVLRAPRSDGGTTREKGSGMSGEGHSVPGTERASRIGVVVVDDHESVRASISRVISLQEDMTVLGEAADGRSALEVVKKARPDLALVDIRMPEMDGLELIRVLRSNYPGMRIIALSAHEDELYVSEALKQGADTYVLKGVPLRDLVGTIRRVMQGRIDLPSEVTEPLISRFRMSDSLLGAVHQAFTAFRGGEDVLQLLACSAAELCGGELYGVALKRDGAFRMVSGRALGEEDFPLLPEEGWSLSPRDLLELANMIEGRHPLVCNEHRLRDRARGWRSPVINMVINPVFLSNEPAAMIIVAGPRPFRLSPPLVRNLSILGEQAGAFLEIERLRLERSRLEEGNRRLKALLGHLVGEGSGGDSAERMMEVLVESMGLPGAALFKWSDGSWRPTMGCGLSEGEVGALAEELAAEAGLREGPVATSSLKGRISGGKGRGSPAGRQVLIIPVEPSAEDGAVGIGDALLLGEGGIGEGNHLPSYLLALVLPADLKPEEEMDVFLGLAACISRHLARLAEEAW